MSTFAVYLTATGEIVSLQIGPTEASIEPSYPGPTYGLLLAAGGQTPLTHYVDGTGSVFVPFPDRPGMEYAWDWTTHSWTVQLTLDQVKLARRIELIATRDRVLLDGFEVDSKVYNCDGGAIAYLTLLAQAAQRALDAGSPFEAHVYHRGNLYSSFTASQTLTLFDAMTEHVMGVHEHAADKVYQVFIAPDIASAKAVAW